jgi:hypothetical protein
MDWIDIENSEEELRNPEDYYNMCYYLDIFNKSEFDGSDSSPVSEYITVNCNDTNPKSFTY